MPVSLAHLDFGFDCGAPSINEFLRRNPAAGGDCRIFTAVNGRERILGFYAIRATTIEFEEPPRFLPDDLTGYPILAALISHLAVDLSCRRRGVGARLLVDALQRICRTGPESGFAVVLVEAQSDKLRSFYLHYGFLPINGEGRSLFLPMKRIAPIFHASSRSH